MKQLFLLTSMPPNKLLAMVFFVFGVLLLCVTLIRLIFYQRDQNILKKELSETYDKYLSKLNEFKEKVLLAKDFKIEESSKCLLHLENSPLCYEKPKKIYGLKIAINEACESLANLSPLMVVLEKKLFILEKSFRFIKEIKTPKELSNRYEEHLKNGPMIFPENNEAKDLKDLLHEYGIVIKAHFDSRTRFQTSLSNYQYSRIASIQGTIKNSLNRIEQIEEKIKKLREIDEERIYQACNFEVLVKRRAEYLQSFCDKPEVSQALSAYSKAGIARTINRMITTGDGENIFEDYNLYKLYMNLLEEYSGPEKQFCKKVAEKVSNESFIKCYSNAADTGINTVVADNK